MKCLLLINMFKNQAVYPILPYSVFVTVDFQNTESVTISNHLRGNNLDYEMRTKVFGGVDQGGWAGPSLILS